MTPPPLDGSNGTGGGAKPRRMDENLPELPMTPEQGCVGCSAGIGLLLLAVLFWAYIYWRNESAFHPGNISPPPIQRKIRRRVPSLTPTLISTPPPTP